jgi:ribA/ribD-fused uncharacterized protein
MFTYNRSQCAVFNKTKELYGGLSNMAGGYPLVVNGLSYFASEHLYQCFRFPDCLEAPRKTMSQKSPMRAKMAGKPYRSTHCRADWDPVRVDVMRYCLRVKLAQHRRVFGSLLLSTGKRPIVEESHKTDFWAAKAIDDEQLSGENNLGILLVALRSEFEALDPSHPYVVQPLLIPNFTLMGKPVQSVTSLPQAGTILKQQATPTAA